MSSYNKKIIRSGCKEQKPVHLNDRAFAQREPFIEQTVSSVVADMIKEAQEEIKAQFEEMNEIIEQKEQEAVARGYESGKEKAREEVREELAVEFDKARERYEEANDYIDNIRLQEEENRELWVRTHREQLVDLCCRFTERILHKQVDQGKYDLEGIFEEVFSDIKGEHQLVWIRVHPLTAKHLTHLQLKDSIFQWRVDPTIGKADFIIETDTDILDASVHAKLEGIKRIIKGVEQSD